MVVMGALTIALFLIGYGLRGHQGRVFHHFFMTTRLARSLVVTALARRVFFFKYIFECTVQL